MFYFRTKLLLLACILSMQAGTAWAQLLLDEVPENAQNVGLEDRVGEFIPLDLVFNDERGNPIGLGKFFHRNKTIILTLNYSDCPGLCVAQLDLLTATLRQMSGEGLGENFEIVTVSIDPNESHLKAASTKDKYVGMLASGMIDRGKATSSWHFLTGKQTEIRALAKAVGFKYHYDAAAKRFNHASATYFISPEGRLCRYFADLGIEPTQLTLAVGEAGRGKITSSLSDMFVQLCYMYDPEANRYSADARRLMAFGGFAFCLLLLGMTAPFWFSRRRPDDDKLPQAETTEEAQPMPASVQADINGVAIVEEHVALVSMSAANMPSSKI